MQSLLGLQGLHMAHLPYYPKEGKWLVMILPSPKQIDGKEKVIKLEQIGPIWQIYQRKVFHYDWFVVCVLTSMGCQRRWIQDHSSDQVWIIEFLAMPFGLNNASTTLCQLMNDVLYKYFG